MHQPRHARRAAGRHDAARQRHVHPLEGGLVAVQDGHQVDHGIAAGDQPRQRGGVVHVGRDQVDVRQRPHRLPVGVAPCWHQEAQAGVALRQPLAQGAADEAAAAQHQHAPHRVQRGGHHGNSRLGAGALAGRGAIGGPSRLFSDGTGWPSTAA
jgi:hypothetical protein